MVCYFMCGQSCRVERFVLVHEEHLVVVSPRQMHLAPWNHFRERVAITSYSQGLLSAEERKMIVKLRMKLCRSTMAPSYAIMKGLSMTVSEPSTTDLVVVLFRKGRAEDWSRPNIAFRRSLNLRHLFQKLERARRAFFGGRRRYYYCGRSTREMNPH